MNKKNIFAFLLMALPALLLTSCLKDQEDTFSEPASIRMSNYLKNTENLLTGNSNGWVLNYFPDRNQSYGGYSYTLKFTGDDVEVRTEVAESPEQTFVSKYRLVADDGPVLTFDTYNDALHLFSTPSSGAYEAMDGDFEFIILSATDEEIVLKGKRSGNIMYMTPLTMSSEEYQTKLASFKTDLVFDTAAGVIEGQNDTLHIYSSLRWIDIQTPDSTIEAPFCYDIDGISLYEDVNIGGQLVRQFKYNENDGSLIAVENPSVSFQGLLIPSIVTSIVGKDLFVSNEAKAYTYVFNLANQFSYTSDASWLTASVDGRTLTLNVTANTTGAPRVGHIMVETDGKQESITVTQMDITDLAGTYTYGSKTVEVVYNGDQTFTLTGLASVGPVKATFNPQTYSMDIAPQYVGMYASTYYIWICPCDGSTFTWSTGEIFAGNNSIVDGKLVISFVNASYPTFWEMAFNSSTASGDSYVATLRQWEGNLVLTKK